ncbi:MAG: hypothetical protein Q9190_003448 [Brigantiaea leucoxantha]
MAGVDMRLEAFAYRELHWHTAGEWSYVMNGSVRVAVVNQDGQSFVDDLVAGDVWFFPPGVPHSLQALDQGVEFLLIFDNGSFSEDSTALVSEMFLRTPKQVMAKNMRTDISAFDRTPSNQLYIFPGTDPGTIEQQRTLGPAGGVPDNESYTYHFRQQTRTVEPGAMREVHWHPTSDEWNFFVTGQARLSIFSAPESGQTFDFYAGDVGYVPSTQSHYIENTGNETVVFLEVLQAPKFTDISVNQWLALTPSQVVEETMNLPADVVENLPVRYPPSPSTPWSLS